MTRLVLAAGIGKGALLSTDAGTKNDEWVVNCEL